MTLVVVTGLLVQRVYTEISVQNGARIENTQWSLHQVQVEFYRFKDLLNDFANARINEEPVQVRYEILLSRLEIARHDGWLIFERDLNLLEALNGLDTEIRQWDAVVQNLSEPASSEPLRQSASALTQRMQDFVVQSHAITLERFSEKRAELVDRLNQVLWTAGALVLPIGALLILLLVQSGRAESTRRKAEEYAEAYKETRDRVEAENRAKSAFLATLSHEIKTPLTGIIGMAELLTAADLSPLGRRYANAVLESSHRLLGMVRDILDYTRLEGTAVQLRNSEVALEETVEAVLDLQTASVLRKKLWLESVFAFGAPSHIVADGHRVRQVLLNLVSNAIKVTDDGGVIVRVSPSPDTPFQVRIAVSDTGPGLREEEIQTLFQPFRQLDQDEERRIAGSGLGLSICKELVTLMGGRIGVDSTPGVGSTFWFELPIGTSDSGAVLSRPETNREVALLAMRSDAEAEAMAVKLERLGYTVVRNSTAMPSPSPSPALAVLDADRDDAQAIEQALPAGVPRIWVGTGLAQVEGDASKDTDLAKPIRFASLRQALVNLRDEVRPPAQEATPASAGPLEPIEGKPDANPRLLIAEDSPMIQNLLKLSLPKAGYQPTFVDNGQAAVDAVRSGSFAAVLMDLHMPIMGGIEATRLIRALPGDAGCTPIIALTANAHEDVDQACREAGMNDFASKPINMPGLLLALANQLQASD
ncbi:ATP-binding protein [Azospirillum sp. SYSU D00513]|uniref:ATP-binding protein n=1 Tax=Azospirillum sp. SYSU D00513 TaxID=2812561 RepID=UPI001A97459C|nr:ATP-binding protein [Azospirillum sp. SYSU D00513]